MKFGVNAWVWVSPCTTDELAALAPRVKKMGFDILEIPIEGTFDLDYAVGAQILKDNGLTGTMCAAMGPDRDLIHGGPTGVSRAVPFTSAIYPIDVWVPRGVLVLEPNYRGSAGYGEKFRALNVRNLGVGDAWDVISGVDALIARGLVDPAKVGTMGWSQGGYISAFLATHDAARFKAISVGAGISDWMTYYVNTDITPFTRQYLKGTPWADPDIYAKTSPITYIKQAKTPTLIQHGATDQRVPLPNAFELYRGLLDNHVPSKLIVYEGFAGIGHGPTKPKSHRATMDHNLEWFDQYMFQVSTKTSNDQK